jgi:hypothetical protein
MPEAWEVRTLSPGRRGLAWRWAEAGRGEDAADGALPDLMAEVEQFALDPPVPPSWVLSGQPDHQLTQLVRDRRTPGRVRVRPALADQLSVPGQQGARRHDPMEAKPRGRRSRQCGQQRPVGPVWSRSGDLTTQDGDLMTQHQDLHVLGSVAPA